MEKANDFVEWGRRRLRAGRRGGDDVLLARGGDISFCRPRMQGIHLALGKRGRGVGVGIMRREEEEQRNFKETFLQSDEV